MRFFNSDTQGLPAHKAEDTRLKWKGGGGGGESQTQSSEPWSEQQPYYREIFENAQNLYNGDYREYYPEQTFANFAPEQAYALTAQTNRALNGSPLVGQAQQQLSDTISGNYLGSNPYLDQEFSRVREQIGNNVDSSFSQAGRYGSGLHASEIAKQTGQAAGQFYGDNYRNERQNQLRATQAAPNLANQDYYDISQLAAVGDARQSLANQQIDELRDRFDFADEYGQELQQLQDYSSLIGGGLGQETTTQTSTESNPLSTGLGILGLGASVFSGGTGGLLGGLFS